MQIKLAFRRRSTGKSALLHDTFDRDSAIPSMAARHRLVRSFLDARTRRRERVHGVAHFRSAI